jgi:DNA-binding CsgD family transcriptional regulator
MSLPIPTEEIYDAATDDECLARLATRLSEKLGGRSGVVHWRHLESGTGDISYSGYFSEEQMEEYDRHFSDCDVWAEAFAAPGTANQAWNIDHLVPSRTYERSRIFNEWIRGMGDDSFHCLGAALRTETLHADIGFHRAKSQGGFDDGAVGQLQECLRHLERMMIIRSRIAAAERACASASGAMNAIGYGLFTLLPDRRLIQCNRAAEAIAERHDGLIVRDARLSAATPRDQKAIQAAIDRAVAPSSPEASALRVARRGGGHYEVSVVSVLAGLAGRQVLVTVTDPDIQDASLAARLRTLYRLSASEAEVAIRISEGASLADLAEERKVAIGTIRNQTKAVAEKLGCGRQAEIVALVRSLPPLRPAA